MRKLGDTFLRILSECLSIRCLIYMFQTPLMIPDPLVNVANEADYLLTHVTRVRS